MITASFEDELLDEEAVNDPAAGAKGRRGRWRRTHFVALLAAGALLWAVFAWVVMPRMLAAAYDGQGAIAFNPLAEDTDEDRRAR